MEVPVHQDHVIGMLLGHGHSGIAGHRSRAYTAGYTEKRDQFAFSGPDVALSLGGDGLHRVQPFLAGKRPSQELRRSRPKRGAAELERIVA